MLTEVFNSGYHQEIVARLHVDCLCWTTIDEEDQQLLAMVATEKTVCFKMDKVPISQHIKHFIKFHLQESMASKAICRLWHEASNDERLWRSFMHLPVSTDLRNSWGGISCASTMPKKVVRVIDTGHKAQTDDLMIPDDTARIMLRAEPECQVMVTASLVLELLAQLHAKC